MKQIDRLNLLLDSHSSHMHLTFRQIAPFLGLQALICLLQLNNQTMTRWWRHQVDHRPNLTQVEFLPSGLRQVWPQVAPKP